MICRGDLCYRETANKGGVCSRCLNSQRPLQTKKGRPAKINKAKDYGGDWIRIERTATRWEVWRIHATGRNLMATATTEPEADRIGAQLAAMAARLAS